MSRIGRQTANLFADGTALPNAVTVVVYAEFENITEIGRNVVFDFINWWTLNFSSGSMFSRCDTLPGNTSAILIHRISHVKIGLWFAWVARQLHEQTLWTTFNKRQIIINNFYGYYCCFYCTGINMNRIVSHFTNGIHGFVCNKHIKTC